MPYRIACENFLPAIVSVTLQDIRGVVETVTFPPGATLVGDTVSWNPEAAPAKPAKRAKPDQ